MSDKNLITPGSLPAVGPAQGDARGDSEKLKTLAAQFESILVAQMLQQMRSSMFENADDDKTSAPLADALFTELSLAISRAGGVGFADSMMDTLQQQTGVGGRVSSGYGWRQDPIDNSPKFHKGLDIALPEGQAIPAPQPGRVVFAGEQSGYGLTVVIDHGQDVTTRYAHLSAIDVRVGEPIAAGQSIGQVGSTGRATGPHLHFEVLEAGKAVNPAEKMATYPGWPAPIS